jgi:hypothetical protein
MGHAGGYPMPIGKCPKCESVVTHVRFEGVDVRESFGTKTWNGISYLCPSCNTVLGAAIDPVALMNDTVTKVVRELKGR